MNLKRLFWIKTLVIFEVIYIYILLKKSHIYGLCLKLIVYTIIR